MSVAVARFFGGRKFIGVFKSLMDCWLGVWGTFQGDVGKFLDTTVDGSEIPFPTDVWMVLNPWSIMGHENHINWFFAGFLNHQQ